MGQQINALIPMGVQAPDFGSSLAKGLAVGRCLRDQQKEGCSFGYQSGMLCYPNAPSSDLSSAPATIGRHPKYPCEVKDVEDSEGCIDKRHVTVYVEALPGRGKDPLLHLLAHQVLDATKINTATAEDAEARYNATIAALHDISPQGALEGMLASQLIATHMAAMDCYKHLNKTGDRATHAYHLNQVNKLSPTYVSLLEALNRHRGKGQQKVTVEHVHVHQGGQAIVGHIETLGGGGSPKTNGSTPCANG